MKLLKYVILAILLLNISSVAYSQFTVNGEFRTRGIADHGYKIPVLKNTRGQFGFDQRSRLILNYKNNKYTTRFTLQDTRIWGSDDMFNKTGVEGNSYSFGVYEAWIDINFTNNSSLRIGRQEWNYDDMRLLSWRNWWTSALSYDGILYQYQQKDNGFFIDLGGSYNNNGSRMGTINNSLWEPEKLKTVNFLNIKKIMGEKITASAMFTLSGKEDPDNKKLVATGTHGINFNYNTGAASGGGLFGNFSFYYQHGNDLKRGSDGSYMNISAYMLSSELGYRTWQKKLAASVGMELISGRDYSNTSTEYNNTRHTFDLLYSGRFPYYGGNINHFIVQDSYRTGTKGGGYFDPYFKVNYKLNKKNIIDLTYFMPVLSTNVKAHTGIDQDTKKPVGAEIDHEGNPVYWKGNLGSYFDLGFTHKFDNEIILKTGFSYALPSDIKNQMVYGYADGNSRQLHELGNNYFGWMMLIVKPKFLDIPVSD